MIFSHLACGAPEKFDHPMHRRDQREVAKKSLPLVKMMLRSARRTPFLGDAPTSSTTAGEVYPEPPRRAPSSVKNHAPPEPRPRVATTQLSIPPLRHPPLARHPRETARG